MHRQALIRRFSLLHPCPSDPERRDVALKTVREGVLTMQGPMTLSQGYFGVVGRQPIFIKGASPNETWG